MDSRVTLHASNVLRLDTYSRVLNLRHGAVPTDSRNADGYPGCMTAGIGLCRLLNEVPSTIAQILPAPCPTPLTSRSRDVFRTILRLPVAVSDWSADSSPPPS